MSADNAAPKGNNRLIWQIITGLILGSIIGQIAHSAQSGFMNSVIGITGIFGSLFVGALPPSPSKTAKPKPICARFCFCTCWAHSAPRWWP